SESRCSSSSSDSSLTYPRRQGVDGRSCRRAQSLGGLIRGLDEQLLLAAHPAAHLDKQVVVAVLRNRTRRDPQLRRRKRRRLLRNLLRAERLDKGHLTLVALARFRPGEPGRLDPPRQAAQRLQMGDRLGEVRQAPQSNLLRQDGEGSKRVLQLLAPAQPCGGDQLLSSFARFNRLVPVVLGGETGLEQRGEQMRGSEPAPCLAEKIRRLVRKTKHQQRAASSRVQRGRRVVDVHFSLKRGPKVASGGEAKEMLRTHLAQIERAKRRLFRAQAQRRLRSASRVRI